jgi:hypothetical protein
MSIANGGFDLGCVPGYVQVELAGGAGSCVGKISCIGRKRKQNPS